MENVKGKNDLLKKIGNIAFYVVLGIVLLYAIFALFSKKEENQISFFGITSLAVQSDSMSPTFDKGDLIFISTDFNLSDIVEEEGVVITYWDSTLEEYNTHRIVNVFDAGEGVYFLTTKGDGNPDNDRVLLRVSSDDLNDIVGVWNGRSWSNFGSFVDGFTGFLKSSLGFFLLIVLPAVGFLAYEVVRFVKIYAEYNNKKTMEDRVKMQEEAIAEAKRQLEAEQKKQEEDKE
ncbi:signal peptidase I [Hujiaoplasma nucleasis]|uniref:Signal peptidase I n=1 Tax=Hujiaoplasma nucleasis TaxID=2725268 RepID=A0A7L6N503_9MOLU|nr:signal peptidase I [Hujiaoplasma nucleasis]QLY40085.1 signal peptidase I [Hujiaoplasma nucleasis]